jgi:hypothetical protein
MDRKFWNEKMETLCGEEVERVLARGALDPKARDHGFCGRERRVCLSDGPFRGSDHGHASGIVGWLEGC